ncbi:MAG: LytTR family DNA-binding domain-containing protein [Lachnospiraceae bacterium]|nr:LytTR family DNA-binding domain-containing protein [Lachnospiraceae bacterium]
MYQIAICDDEEFELDKVEQMLKDYHAKSAGGEFLIRRFVSSEDIFLQITTKNYQPDLILLDIYMPGSSGIETAKKLRNMGNTCRIVFMTSSQEHALDAFGVDAFSYLVKPVSRETLFPALDKVITDLVNNQSQYILLQTANDCVQRVELSDIIYCEAQRKKQCVFLKENESVYLRMTMKKLYEMLSSYKRFVKLGASYIVNMEHIEQLYAQMMLLDSGEEVYLPRGSYKELREQYFEYYFGDKSLMTIRTF